MYVCITDKQIEALLQQPSENADSTKRCSHRKSYSSQCAVIAFRL